MSKKQESPIVSQPVPHPGVELSRILESKEIKQKDFATELGVSFSQLNEIINGKRNITPDFALLLEASLGMDAKKWLDMQTAYNLHKSRTLEENQEKIELLKRWNSIKENVPVSYFKKHSYITGDPKADEDTLKKIYSAKSVEDIIKRDITKIAKFRKSEKLTTDPVNLLGYVMLVEFLSKEKNLEMKISKFKPENENLLIDKLRKAFLGSNILENLKSILEEFGIKLIIKEKPEHVPVDGLAFWSNKNPAIALTLRFKRIDNLAFTLFHEICHAFRHVNSQTTEVFIDDLESKETSKEEKEANDFALQNLIPQEEWNDFITKNFLFDDNIIIEFAKKINTHPAIVRGRLCHDGLVSYKSRTSIPYVIN